MTQPDCSTTALPCVGIDLDDLVLAGALPAFLAEVQELPAEGTRFVPARPPLSDEQDEDSLDLDDGDDDDDEDEEEDEEEEEEEGEEDEDGDEDEEADDDEEDDEEEDEDKK